MATVAVIATPERAQISPATSRLPWIGVVWFALFVALSFSVLAIHGYHPLAEDGGLYVAGIEHLLNPDLFPHDTAFVAAHLHYSLFAPLIVTSIRFTHLPLAWALFLVETLSIGLTLFGARQLLRRCVTSDVAQLGGIALLAAWWTLPVAGTSLLLFDPYLTARSLSTPFSLLAIAYALDDETSTHRRSSVICTLCLLLAALFHPLMAAYAATMVIVLVTAARATGRRRLLLWTLIAGFALACAVTLHALAPAESPSIVAAAHSRYYWFLSRWRWYELCGLAGPMAVLALLRLSHLSRAADALCETCIGTGLLGVLLALLFAHDDAPTHLIARLQPLRIFLPIYAVMALLLGTALTRRALQSQRLVVRMLPAATLLATAAFMFACQRATFLASQHLELPWRVISNPWSSAFVWVRDHTPQEALFAIDANYITTAGEDAQAFRATAQRSVLPDFSKDGGEASITPALADLWQRGVEAQTGLSTESTTLRDTRLRPLGVTWMVLRSAAQTTHPCPYDNGVVKVCPLAL